MAKKQKVLALLTAGTMAASMLPFNVFAAPEIVIGACTATDANEDGILEVTVPYTATGIDQTTLLVNSAAEISSDYKTINYIDQQAGNIGKFEFKVDSKALSALGSGELYIKVGGTGIDEPSNTVLADLPLAGEAAPVVSVDGSDLDTEMVTIVLESDDGAYDFNAYTAAVTSIKVGSIEVKADDITWQVEGGMASYALSETSIQAILAAMEGAAEKDFDVVIKAKGYANATATATFTSSKNAILADLKEKFPGVAEGEDGVYTAPAGTIVTSVANDELTVDTITIAVPEGATVASVEASITEALTEVTANQTYTVARDAENTIDVTVTFEYGDVTVKITKTIAKIGAVDGPTVDTAKTKVYDREKPFGLEGYKRMFIKLEDGNGAWTPVHSDAESVIAYSAEREGYDALIKTSAASVEEILAEIEWSEAAPTVVITSYGDANDDGKINALDMALIKRIGLSTYTSTLAENMSLDGNGDCVLNALDMALIKRLGLGTLEVLPVVEDK